MKFRYIKILIATTIIFVCSLIFSSCNSTKSFGGTLSITARRIELEVYAEFDEDDRLSSSTPYVVLYTVDDDGNTTYEDREELSFDDDYTQTDSATFDGLDEDTKYVLKLFVTYDSESYEVCSIDTATSPMGSTEDNPILVSTYDELMDVSNDNEAYYKLSNDIDCSGNTIDSLFNSSNIFKGGFDGANFTISNVVLPSNTYLGLFGYTNGATIKNLNLDTVSLASTLASSGRGETYCGALVGKAVSSTIENVNVKNVDFDITFSTSANVALGGFGGKLESTEISDCSLEDASINVIKAQKTIKTGLFLGYIEGESNITNCHSTGEITSVTYLRSSTDVYSYVGGFIGVSDANTGNISDCYTVVDITITENTSQTSLIKGHRLFVGGFVGGNSISCFKIENCAVIADISVNTKYSGRAYIGGLVGSVSLYGCKLSNAIYIPKEKGIVVNYVEESDEETDEDEIDDSSEDKAKIYVSLALGTNTTFTTTNIYVSNEELISYNSETDTLISDNYAVYTDSDKANFSEVIQTVIESYINK